MSLGSLGLRETMTQIGWETTKLCYLTLAGEKKGRKKGEERKEERKRVD